MCKHFINDITGKSARQKQEEIARQQAAIAAQQAEAEAQRIALERQRLEEQRAELARQEAIRQQAEEEARQAQLAREAAITRGGELINEHFGTFNDDYYSALGNDITEFYVPQINKEAERVRGDLQSRLARAGTLDSSVGAAAFEDLDSRLREALSGVDAYRADQIAEHQGRVADARTGLITLNNEIADPALVSQQATSLFSNLDRSPSLPPLSTFTDSPLGSLFADLALAGANFVAADQQRDTPRIKLFDPGESSTRDRAGASISFVG